MQTPATLATRWGGEERRVKAPSLEVGGVAIVVGTGTESDGQEVTLREELESPGTGGDGTGLLGSVQGRFACSRARFGNCLVLGSVQDRFACTGG